MSAPLPARPVEELADAVRRGEVGVRDVVDSVADALRASESGAAPVHAFLSVDLEGALARGAHPAVDAPLAGVPVAVKDNLATLHLPTTCGSLLLRDYRSPFEATAVRRLRDAGALVIGKTNLDEFGMGSSTEHSAYGPTRHPLDRSRVPGGSSGGSAAAVAAGITPAALGSDTGGSVRQPAAFCGIVGFKPTYGRLSRYGLVSFASSLDQVGVLARTVPDAARVLETICGHDPLDSTSAELPPPRLTRAAGAPVEGLVVGVPHEYFPHTLDRGVARACRAALYRLEALGVEIREVSLPHTDDALSAYYVLAPAEASTNLARFDGMRFGARAEAASVAQTIRATRARFGAEVKRRVILGTYVLSAGYRGELYARAQRVRSLVAEDFRLVFASGVDALLTPTTPTTAFALGERTRDPHRMYLSDVFTVPASLAGLPALSVPVGAVDGLPVGAQLIGRPWDEATLVRLGAALHASGR